MEQLLALQKLQFDPRSRKSEAQAEMDKIRVRIPTPILAHYERLVARGKKGVAIVRNGVCGSCHLRLTGGKLVTVTYTDEVCLCDNCGRYLYLAEVEPVDLVPAKPAVAAAPAKRRAARATAAHVG